MIILDNPRTCACINGGRVLSGTMRTELKILLEVREEYNMKIIVQQIGTSQNVITDLLSRGRNRKAQVHAQKEGDVTWGTIEA